MNNKKLQDYLAQFPDEMPVKLRVKDNSFINLSEEHILHTSDTAYVNNLALERDWDTEDGKVELGNGKQYLLFNPVII